MNLKSTRRYVAISASVAVTSLLVLATPASAGETPHSKTIDIVGGNFLKINESVTTTYHFKPGTVHVNQGDTIVLTNHTDDGHTFSLVDPSLLPTTVGGVFSCGGPGTICGAVIGNHFPGPPTPGPPPTSCPATIDPTATCIPYIDGGHPSILPPGLDTVNTLLGEGDSVVILPGGAPIPMTVTAPPGSVLNFMCVFHAWMQGKLVVGKKEADVQKGPDN